MTKRGTRKRAVNITAARLFANSVLLIALIGSGVSLALFLIGNRTLAAQVCAGSVGVGAVVLVVGGVLVARSRG